MAKRDRTASSTSVGSDGPPAKATKSGAAAAEDDETDKKKRASQTGEAKARRREEPARPQGPVRPAGPAQPIDRDGSIGTPAQSSPFCAPLTLLLPAPPSASPPPLP